MDGVLNVEAGVLIGGGWESWAKAEDMFWRIERRFGSTVEVERGGCSWGAVVQG